MYRKAVTAYTSNIPIVINGYNVNQDPYPALNYRAYTDKPYYSYVPIAVFDKVGASVAYDSVANVINVTTNYFDLQTKNSELQANNFELQTSNSDLQTKNSELQASNSNLQNQLDALIREVEFLKGTNENQGNYEKYYSYSGTYAICENVSNISATFRPINGNTKFYANGDYTGLYTVGKQYKSFNDSYSAMGGYMIKDDYDVWHPFAVSP